MTNPDTKETPVNTADLAHQAITNAGLTTHPDVGAVTTSARTTEVLYPRGDNEIRARLRTALRDVGLTPHLTVNGEHDAYAVD
jgi:hypothetical protein